MLHNLDVSRLEAAERHRAMEAGGDGVNVVNTSVHLGRPNRDIRLAGEIVGVLLTFC